MQTRFETKESADFWIRFADTADLEPAKDIADWGERGQFVYDALTSTAKASQADVVADLKAAGADYESFWISNAILVEGGTEKLAEQVATSREVKQVHERIAAELIEPVERKASTKNAPLAIEWGLDAIGAPEVWDMGYTGDGITVASIDTGVDLEHPALVRQYRGYHEDGGRSNDYNWFDSHDWCKGAPCDNHDQGTHVMGTMVGDDGEGNQIGVAPGADWIAANGCVADCTEANLLASGQWILAPTRIDGSDPDPAQRPHIVNNSWGLGGLGVIDNFMSEEIAAWEAAGIFGAWAAGNVHERYCGTASSPGANVATYSAGAFGESGEIADFSAWGPGEEGETKPNLAAPGEEVRSSMPGGGYAVFSGTSMAAPHLAGAVALLWSAAPVLIGDIEFTKELLDETSVDTAYSACRGDTLADNNVWGEGKLDVEALVSNAPIDGYGILVGTVTGPDGEPVVGARVTAAGGRSDLTNAEGAYRLGLEEGSRELTVSAFGFLDVTAQADVVEGGTTTLDVSLEAAPTAIVSGTVTDGSGHGWPLDAKISVQGAPSSVVAWTNPFTGKYSFELPQSETHTLVVESAVTGYATFTQAVELGTEPASADVALSVIAGCTAPGYAVAEPRALEEFESGEVPDGWTVEDLAGTGQVWAFDDPFEYGNGASGLGLFAEVNSTGHGDGGVQDTTLTSRSYDLSDLAAPFLKFDELYYGPFTVGGFADVDLSLDGGESWESSLHQSAPEHGGMIAALSGADGQSDVRVRFHYSGGWRGWWQIDNVALGGCVAVEGGLVAGLVRDRNTGDGLNGATVTVGKQNMKTFDPENPRVGRGFYSFFSARLGARQIRYTAKEYTAKKVEVKVVADAVVRKDVKLAAPLLTISPASLVREVRLGGSRSGSFTVTNEGTAPADVEVAPSLAVFKPLGSATGSRALKGATGDATEVSTASSSGAESARGTAANDGGGFVRNGERPGRSVTPSAPPSLLAEGTTITHSSSQDITPDNSVACKWGEANWMRTFTLEDFEIQGAFAVTNVSFGVESVKVTTDATVNLYELNGKEVTYENMTLLGSSVVTLERQGPTMVDVPVTGTAPAGSTLVVEVVGYDAAFFIGSNAEPETAPSYLAGNCASHFPATAAELGYPDIHMVLNVTGDAAVDAPWLDIQPPTFTLQPGQSVEVQVGLDSSHVDQPGTYTARVYASGGTPYDEPRVQISMKVTPPPSWGRIAGTVTGVTCDNETVPLDGAFVVIDGSKYDTTLVTGPEGGYARWMGVSNNRLTVLASANGYPSKWTNASIVKGETVVRNFELTEFCG